METSIFFDKIDIGKLDLAHTELKSRFGANVEFAKANSDVEDIELADIAIIGVNEDRQSIGNQGCAAAPDEVRRQLYKLYPVNKQLKIIDLGNIRRGETVNDTYFALSKTVSELLKASVIPIVIGGSHDLTYPMYLAYESIKRIINLVNIDARIDLGTPDELPDSQSFLSKIILRKPNYLFNYANIGHQTYFVNPNDLKILDKLFFDAYRLGEIRDDLTEAEPVIRSADLFTVDMSAIRLSDAPGNSCGSPHGFFGEEMCQLVRYAGLASRLSAVGFFEMNPQHDQNHQTAQLAAQMIWYFLDGFAMRQDDFPVEHSTDFVKYWAGIPSHDQDLVFYKSKITERWWMQLPVSKKKKPDLSRHIMVPCSYKDYLTAGKQDIPDRWWKAYQKLM